MIKVTSCTRGDGVGKQDSVGLIEKKEVQLYFYTLHHEKLKMTQKFRCKKCNYENSSHNIFM